MRWQTMLIRHFSSLNMFAEAFVSIREKNKFLNRMKFRGLEFRLFWLSNQPTSFIREIVCT